MREHKTETIADSEIARRMEAGIRRALNTLPKPTKELVGMKRAKAQKQSRVKKARREDQQKPQ